jgi:hypothetical protein
VRLTNWVAIAAFAISLTALLSNLTLAWLKWPRIVVEVAVIRRVSSVVEAQASQDNPESKGDLLVLAIINTGSEPITIKNMGFKGSGSAKKHRFDHLDAWPALPQSELPKHRGAVDQPVLPVRIEGHGRRVYEYGESALTRLPPNFPYHGFAQRYKSVRWWPNRPTVLETTSRETVFRHAT